MSQSVNLPIDMHRVVRNGIRGSTRGLNRRLLAKPEVAPSLHNNINNMAFQMRNARRSFTSTRYVSAEASENKDKDENSTFDASKEASEEDGGSEPTESSGAGDDSASKIAALEKEVKELKDAVLRSLAEEDNVRRIARKDVESANNYAITKFAKALLDVSDNFERALDALPEEKRKSLESGEGDPLFKSFVEGIVAVDKGMTKTFSQFGVVKYGEVGEAFDPEQHDALFQMPDDTKEENTIGQVVKTGYKLKGRVIRAAQCGIVKKA